MSETEEEARVAEYELAKRWVTGERAVKPEEDIERELVVPFWTEENVSTLICICGRRPAPGIRHERECCTPFIIVLCCIGAIA